MSDLISRQAAIESIQECAEAAHDNHEWDMEQGYLNAIECIDEEPSAQPAPQAIKDCRSCKYGKYNDHYDTCFCYNKEDCSDWDKWESAQSETCAYWDRESNICALHRPSAQPVRHGRWIEHEVKGFDGCHTGRFFDECSECGKLTPEWRKVTGYHGWYFCPKCGARMDGKENEQNKESNSQTD